MTKDELISKQQLEIEEYKLVILKNKEIKKKLHFLVYGCGQPLNDNCLFFNKEQKMWVFEVAELAENINISEYEEDSEDE